METTNQADCAPMDRALAAMTCASTALKDRTLRRKRTAFNSTQLSETSIERRLLSQEHDSTNPDAVAKNPPKTMLYLAYGSNLSDETFRGKRGIKPLSAINVQVPELRLTFDLPGIPYVEPCFANTARRDPNNDPPPPTSVSSHNEKSPLLPLDSSASSKDYHKDRWHKGLIGVVYEVTPTDYAHIIATEGGGSGYQDIVVDCYPFATTDPSVPVPQFPSTTHFKAHTLFAPAVPEGSQPPSDGGRFSRPDPAYAQASARYLKLITDGADERKLPTEYLDYLYALRPYTPTTQKQKLGQFVFLTFWLPVITFVFSLTGVFGDEKGRAPAWVRLLAGAIFGAVWGSYDGFFKGLFGDGERTITKGREQEEDVEGRLRESEVGKGWLREKQAEGYSSIV